MRNFKESRQFAGYSQAKLAAALHVSQQSLSDYENGKTNPDLETLVKMAEILNVSVDYLLGRTDDLGTPIGISPSSFSTSPSEQELILKFRKISPESQETILRVLETALQAEKHLQ